MRIYNENRGLVVVINDSKLQCVKITPQRHSRGIGTFSLVVNAAFPSSPMHKWGMQYLGRCPTLQFKPLIYAMDINQPFQAQCITINFLKFKKLLITYIFILIKKSHLRLYFF